MVVQRAQSPPVCNQTYTNTHQSANENKETPLDSLSNNTNNSSNTTTTSKTSGNNNSSKYDTIEILPTLPLANIDFLKGIKV